nr:hypothetical protein [Lacticaseibacillus manihotivorans]
MYSFAELKQRLPKGVHTAIVAVPSSSQASVIPQLEAAGITAIMTFAPQRSLANRRPRSAISISPQNYKACYMWPTKNKKHKIR